MISLAVNKTSGMNQNKIKLYKSGECNLSLRSLPYHGRKQTNNIF